MQETKTTVPVDVPEKKNLGAKIGVAFAFGSVGTKLSSPVLLMDLNSLFPKGMGMGEKMKTTFSRNIFVLANEQVGHYMQKGHSWITSLFLATKWYSAVSTVAMLGLGTVGWMRAERIENSSDIVKHPIQSTKILLGIEEPEEKRATTHAEKLQAERAQATVTQR